MIFNEINQQSAYDRQMSAMRETAKENYMYGEKAADNAARRANEYFDYTFDKSAEYNDPSSQVRRIKDAGLSVGLMYGGAGTTGAGAGSTAAPQGGGASGMAAPNIPSGTEKAATMATMAKTMAEAKLAEAQAKNIQANTETTDQTRKLTIGLLKEEGTKVWLENVRTKLGYAPMSDFVEEFTNEGGEIIATAKVIKSTSEYFGKVDIDTKSANVKDLVSAGLQAINMEEEGRYRALLAKEDFMNYATKLAIELMKGEAARAQATAAEMQAKFATGAWAKTGMVAGLVLKAIGLAL